MGQTQIMQQDKPGITGIRRAEEQLPRPLALVFAGPMTYVENQTSLPLWPLDGSGVWVIFGVLQ